MPRVNKQIRHNRITFVNNCQPKRKYSSEKEAIKAADYQMLLDINLELSVYKCDTCNKWHLTRIKIGQ
ncbi:MAG: hypothetical protein WCQ49_02560 [Candidatus Saccharibacteria bacterium]